MKKLLSLTLCIMLVLLTLTTSVYATSYTYDSFVTEGGYGTKTKVSDNITNINGIFDATMGNFVGPFSKASSAKLADGISEETYVEINFDTLKTTEFFEVSLALKNKAGEYVSEAIVFTQKTADNKVTLTSSWAPNFKATITENGVYTYRWNMFIKDGKTYVNFTLLDYDTVIGSTGNIDFDSIKTADTKNPIAEQEDVSVKYLWFLNIKAENGINVYTGLPAVELVPPTDEDKDNEVTPPVDEDKNDETKPPVDEETKDDVKPPVEEIKDESSEEKDETPKTGTINIALYISVAIFAIALAGIITFRKHNK